MGSIWLSKPKEQWVDSPVEIGDVARHLPPGSGAAALQLLVFLRHVGCPFAEQAVRECRAWAARHPLVDVCVISHGDVEKTAAWLAAIGGIGRARVHVDEDRILHGQWGIGYAPFLHFGGAQSLWGVMKLWPHGVRNRSASGTRWQRSAMFLIRQGRVRWLHVPSSAGAFALPPEAVLTAKDEAV